MPKPGKVNAHHDEADTEHIENLRFVEDWERRNRRRGTRRNPTQKRSD